MNVRLDFSEQTIIYQYFSFIDIVGLLGGLWATYNSIMAKFGVVAIVMYVYNLASMTKRKDRHRHQFIEIKQYMKHLPLIRI